MPDPLPLCVDLDGTLIETDILIESLRIACRSWRGLVALPLLALHGKAGLKAGLAKMCPIGYDRLPYDPTLIAFLRARKARGQQLILVTASNIAVARRIDQHLDHLFDDVMASDDRVNLRGERKAQALVQRYGERGFVYIGNDATDLKVWARAGGAMIVGATASVVQRARYLCPVEQVFTHRKRRFGLLSVLART